MTWMHLRFRCSRKKLLIVTIFAIAFILSIKYILDAWLDAVATLSEKQIAVQNWKLRPDPHDFKYLHNPVDRCRDTQDSTKILLIIFVNSSPGNRKRRAYIRKTFGGYYESPSLHGNDFVTRIVFLLGAGVSDKLQADINLESNTSKDIVQESFVDGYLNLTRKTVMGMKWVTNFCRRARYTMTVDDDVLINMPLVYDILQTASPIKFTLGTVKRHSSPVRSPRGHYKKFYTPRSVYPQWYYPPYFNGHAYILSTDVVENIYRVSKETNLFPWADVFVGMCLQKLGIRLGHSERFLNYEFPMASRKNISEDRNDVVEIRKCISVYHFTESLMDQLWSIWTRKI